MLPGRIYSCPRSVLSRPRALSGPPLALVAVLLSLLVLLVLAAAAPAAEPATVTVEVEGLSETKAPPMQVTTTTAAVVKNNAAGMPEGSCPGTNAAGALQLATAGNWNGKWYGGEVKEGKFKGLGYAIEMIDGESHAFGSGYFWQFWLNDKAEEEEGVCEAELHAGDRVLLFPCSESGVCPTPLGIEAPAVANAGEAVTVTVKQYNPKGEASPAVGANVAGGGMNATTDSQGHTTMRFSGDGTYTLHASGSNEGPPAVRSETTICVHEGNDGTCGTSTTVSSSPVRTPSSTTTNPSSTGVFALVARASSVSDGHVYPRRHAPRLLSGTVIAHSAVTSISLELRRRFKGRCSTYNATLERFVKARCGTGSVFKVANGGTSFSYLLPAKLPPGRYVLDIHSTDAAGNHTALVRGSTRTIFYVR
jgi:hypothetical protein